MRRVNLNVDHARWVNLPMMSLVAIFIAAGFPFLLAAQQPGQKTFSSPEEASHALVTAAQGNDEKAMLEILGPDRKEIVSSGDAAEDSENRATFVARYQQMHRLVLEPDGTVVLYVGAENWPTPIPLTKKNNSWYFDSAAGEAEILYRRVGRNEISTIKVCQELAAAQKEFYSAENNHYAHKIFSAEGQHDGLYWKTAAGAAESPIGPLVASAFVEGHASPAIPFRGYYYRLLTHPGGGAMGFAFVAYPAEYRSSGVMTFIVGQDGVVYERDLGRKTEAHAQAISEYNPSSGWRRADEMFEQTAEDRKTQ